MRFVIQRVSAARVSVDGETVGSIGNGLLVLCGIARTDTEETADKMVRKLVGLRIFRDGDGKTNLSLADVGGSLLMISQFTLCADCSRGNRPSFFDAGRPEMAEPLYRYILEIAARSVPDVQHGIFGATMEVELTNSGPFTVVLDSDDLK
jgi:D-tyrosyl-tRNA(Tyr) deacylase